MSVKEEKIVDRFFDFFSNLYEVKRVYHKYESIRDEDTNVEQ